MEPPAAVSGAVLRPGGAVGTRVRPVRGLDAGPPAVRVVQAAWAFVLGRCVERGDIVFGVTCSGRPAELPGIEIGPMVLESNPRSSYTPDHERGIGHGVDSGSAKSARTDAAGVRGETGCVSHHRIRLGDGPDPPVQAENLPDGGGPGSSSASVLHATAGGEAGRGPLTPRNAPVPGMVVLDEAHHVAALAFSEHGSERARFEAFRCLAHGADRLLLLSASGANSPALTRCGTSSAATTFLRRWWSSSGKPSHNMGRHSSS